MLGDDAPWQSILTSPARGDRSYDEDKLVPGEKPPPKMLVITMYKATKIIVPRNRTRATAPRRAFFVVPVAGWGIATTGRGAAGLPQLGHAGAWSEMSLPQSGQVTRAILCLPHPTTWLT